MLGGVTQGGWRLTFRGRQAPQEAGISVNVFFYLKKVGRQRKEETTESQSENGKQDALDQICRFRMCNVQFISGVKLRPKLTNSLGCIGACRGGSGSAPTTDCVWNLRYCIWSPSAPSKAISVTGCHGHIRPISSHYLPPLLVGSKVRLNLSPNEEHGRPSWDQVRYLLLPISVLETLLLKKGMYLQE